MTYDNLSSLSLKFSAKFVRLGSLGITVKNQKKIKKTSQQNRTKKLLKERNTWSLMMENVKKIQKALQSN